MKPGPLKPEPHFTSTNNLCINTPPNPFPESQMFYRYKIDSRKSSGTIVAVHGTYMGATKINHEQNHIGEIVDYLSGSTATAPSIDNCAITIELAFVSSSTYCEFRVFIQEGIFLTLLR